jgi:death on curing protein
LVALEGLTLADFLLIAEAVLDIDAERLAHAADLGRVESALAAPFAGWGDTDFYPGTAAKAAVLCSRLMRNHPLPDGNKRVAYLAMRELLARNGYEWVRPDDGETAEMIERLAASDVSEEEFAAWVAEHVA